MSEEHHKAPPFWTFLRRFPTYFLTLTVCAFVLRLVFYFKFPHVTGDSLVYGDIAKNWLDYGTFGLTHSDGVHPTLIRLPGYPGFIAGCFVLLGREHYHAVLLAQIVIDVITCFVIADLTRRTISERAARFAFLLAALCPFTANYTVAPLAETLSIFFAAVALDAAAAGFSAIDEGGLSWSAWIWCGIAVACGILLRPDGGILLVAIGLYLLWRMWRGGRKRAHLFWAGVLVLAISLAPLVPWTIRNWREFHVVQPLVPKLANDPDEFVPDGFDKWVRTWAADYVSTEEVYWVVPGDKVDLSLTPSRAFDNAGEREKTQAIFNDYSKILVINPALNDRLMQLANERIERHPLRYYLWLPTLRSLDMWLRPRTEMLPLNSRWWEFSDDTESSVIATLWGLLNLLFVVAAVMAIIRGPHPRYLGMMLLFVVLRSAFLGTISNPEPRYTLECYPVVLLLGGAWISVWKEPARLQREARPD
ncbi:MAG TPA: glycosyltransferase family 39 protein [Terriglobales bacterium]|nr:glycosyltransferase family 39 protein [Terriglobales bacterium]